MKTSSLFLLIFTILLASCAPKSVVTPSPVFTNTPLVATIPEPTQTADGSFSSCPWILGAEISSTGVLEIVYGSDHHLVGLESGFYHDSYHTTLWSWSEETQAAVQYQLPPDAVGPKISADHHWIVFRRDLGETKSELWVIDTKGQNERKLATVSFDEVKARNPNVNLATLKYGWVPGTNKVYYLVQPPTSEYDVGKYDAFVLINIDSGKAMPLAKPGEAHNVVFAPDGGQAAVPTSNEVRIVSTQDGRVQFTIPALFSPAYSPDGKYLIGFTDEGILRMSTEDGQWQVIPLAYTVIVPPGDNPYALSPRFTWVGNSTIFVPITNLPEGVFQISDPDLLANPDATFTVWRVDLTDGTVQPVRTFTGYTPSVAFSPDGKYLLFWKQERQAQSPNGKYLAFQKLGVKPGGIRPQKLFLADLYTGEILATIDAVDFFAWSPYSNLYIYSQVGEPVNGIPTHPFYLGQIGEEPFPLGRMGVGFDLLIIPWWVDAERVLLPNEGCGIRLISVGAKVEEVTIVP